MVRGIFMAAKSPILAAALTVAGALAGCGSQQANASASSSPTAAVVTSYCRDLRSLQSALKAFQGGSVDGGSFKASLTQLSDSFTADADASVGKGASSPIRALGVDLKSWAQALEHGSADNVQQAETDFTHDIASTPNC
jgi:hypothetical protein